MRDLEINPLDYNEELRISTEAKKAYFISEKREEKKIKLFYHLEDNATFDLTIVDIAPSDMDVDISVLMEENSTCNIQVATLNVASFNKRYTVNVDHKEGKTYSRTKMAGINASDGKLELLGSSLIRNGAKRADSRQEGKITNLNKKAKSNVSPSLLIKENDVNASHGAALGAYDERQLFYLMSRGLSMQESKKLITYGSLLPIIETLEDEKLQEKVKSALGELTL